MASKTPFPVRLQTGINVSREKMRYALENRQRILTRYSAGFYGPHTDTIAEPVNIIWRYYGIMMSFLAAGCFKSLVTARAGSGYGGTAMNLGLALNHLKDEIDAYETFRSVVRDSFGFVGMTKVGIAHAYEIQIGDTTHEAGQPYWDDIDASDMFIDMGATKYRNLEFIGHSYTLPEDYVKTSGLYKNYDKITPSSRLYGDASSGASANDERSPAKLSRADTDIGTEYYDLKPWVRLQDAWLLDEKVLVTIPIQGEGDNILRTVDQFPEGGPYDLLGYHWFPQSVLPIPPAYSIMDLDYQLNRLMRSMDRKADREKTVLAYEGVAAKDAERVIATADGYSVRVENIDRMKEITLGGINNDSMIYAEFLNRNISEQAGNLYNLGGIRSEAGTLGQEQIITAKSRGPVEDQLTAVVRFCTNIDRKLAWYLMSDPLIEIPMIKHVPGVGPIDVVYNQESIEGDFLDYNFNIDPYSTQGTTPEETYNKLLQVVNTTVYPLIETAAAQGLTVDVRKLTKLISQFVDLEDLPEIWTDGQPVQVDPGPYQPMQGQTRPKSGQPDGRLSTGGRQEIPNLQQQQMRTGGLQRAAV